MKNSFEIYNKNKSDGKRFLTFSIGMIRKSKSYSYFIFSTRKVVKFEDPNLNR